MGGILPKTNITNQVAVGKGGEAAVGEASESPLIVPSVRLACIKQTPPDCSPIVELKWIRKDRLQQPGVSQGRPEAEFSVVVLPAAAPAGPAPAMVVVAKVVTALATPLAVLEVVATDAPHPCVVAVALQQGGAVVEEVRMGNAVILEDDALLNLLEEPGDGTADAKSAALVHIGVKLMDLTGPVDLRIDHRAGGGNLLGFAGTLGVGAVAGHKNVSRRCRTNGVDHLAQSMGAAPGNKEYWGAGGIQGLLSPKEVSVSIKKSVLTVLA